MSDTGTPGDLLVKAQRSFEAAESLLDRWPRGLLCLPRLLRLLLHRRGREGTEGEIIEMRKV